MTVIRASEQDELDLPITLEDMARYLEKDIARLRRAAKNRVYTKRWAEAVAKRRIAVAVATHKFVLTHGK